MRQFILLEKFILKDIVSLVWVVYYWVTPFLDIEQTHWEKFTTRNEARDFLRKLKRSVNFVKADEIRQYKLIQMEPI